MFSRKPKTKCNLLLKTPEEGSVIKMAAFAGIGADANLVITAIDIFASKEEQIATFRGFGVSDVFTSLLSDK